MPAPPANPDVSQCDRQAHASHAHAANWNRPPQRRSRSAPDQAACMIASPKCRSHPVTMWPPSWSAIGMSRSCKRRTMNSQSATATLASSRLERLRTGSPLATAPGSKSCCADAATTRPAGGRKRSGTATRSSPRASPISVVLRRTHGGEIGLGYSSQKKSRFTGFGGVNRDQYVADHCVQGTAVPKLEWNRRNRKLNLRVMLLPEQNSVVLRSTDGGKIRASFNLTQMGEAPRNQNRPLQNST